MFSLLFNTLIIIFLNVLSFFLLKDVILSDIDGDGYMEMVIGLTDRVVRSYSWLDPDPHRSTDVENSKDLGDKFNDIFNSYFQALVSFLFLNFLLHTLNH